MRDRFDLMLDMRKQLRELVHHPNVKKLMRNDGDIASLELNFISESPDSEIATLLELLETDLPEFFFGCKINVTNDEEITASKKLLPRSY